MPTSQMSTLSILRIPTTWRARSNPRALENLAPVAPPRLSSTRSTTPQAYVSGIIRSHWTSCWWGFHSAQSSPEMSTRSVAPKTLPQSEIRGADNVSVPTTSEDGRGYRLLPAATAANSQEFFAEKTVTLVVGYQVGSGYDTVARFVARHLPRFIPGTPTVIVRNMPGAGTLTAANYVANSGPKDGTTIALIARGMLIEPLLGGQSVRI